jgi:hypothetical protein
MAHLYHPKLRNPTPLVLPDFDNQEPSDEDMTIDELFEAQSE